MDKLKQIVERLRGPGGCPWDQKQTHQSLVPSLIEESHEVADAVYLDDPEELREELGDLLLQVVMHSVIAEETNRFTLNEVQEILCEKLIRRHPHVFGTDNAETADDVVTLWEDIKQAEKKGRERKSALDGVPRALPSLQFAQKLQKKAARVNFDWPDHGQGSLDKMTEEIAEMREALETADDDEALAEELGDFLFATVNFARKRKLDAEGLLRQASLKFERRFRAMEELAAGRDLDFAALDLEAQEALWQEVKAKANSNTAGKATVADQPRDVHG